MFSLRSLARTSPSTCFIRQCPSTFYSLQGAFRVLPTYSSETYRQFSTLKPAVKDAFREHVGGNSVHAFRSNALLRMKNAFLPQQRRNISTPQPNRNSPNFWDRFLFHLKANLSRDLLILFGLGAGVYFIYIVSDWFSSITFKNIATWSFSAGVASTAAVFLTYLAARRYFVVRSSNVYKATLRRVLDDSYIREQLGTPLQTSKFRAYSYYYPETQQHEMESNMWRQLQFWKPVHMQMLFKIHGAKGEGMVSCDVSKLPSIKTLLKEEYIFHSLIVTLHDGRKVILSGKDADVFQGVTNLR